MQTRETFNHTSFSVRGGCWSGMAGAATIQAAFHIQFYHLGANSEMCAYAAMLQCLWSYQPVYSIKQITPGPGNMTTNITIYSLILISVSTNHNISLMVLPLLPFCFCFCLLLRTKSPKKEKKPEGSLKFQILSYFIIKSNCLSDPVKTPLEFGQVC